MPPATLANLKLALTGHILGESDPSFVDETARERAIFAAYDKITVDLSLWLGQASGTCSTSGGFLSIPVPGDMLGLAPDVVLVGGRPLAPIEPEDMLAFDPDYATPGSQRIGTPRWYAYGHTDADPKIAVVPYPSDGVVPGYVLRYVKRPPALEGGTEAWNGRFPTAVPLIGYCAAELVFSDLPGIESLQRAGYWRNKYEAEAARLRRHVRLNHRARTRFVVG